MTIPGATMDDRLRVEHVLRQLIRCALLRIRNAGWKGDAALCAIEADHIHNLPGVLNPELSTDHFEGLLQFYWNTERPVYLEQRRRHRLEKGIAVDTGELTEIWDAISLYRQGRSKTHMVVDKGRPDE